MTDDCRLSESESDRMIAAAMRLARQISQVLGAQRGRRAINEAERIAILREAFQYGAVADDQPQ